MRTGIKLAVLVVTMAGLGWAYQAIPALRVRVIQEGQAWLGWTEVARQADPVGFTNHVERRLKEDLQKLQATRRELAAEVGTLSRKIREQQAMAEQAERLAEEFRGAYQQAVENHHFPMMVREAAYTEDQAVSQVSLLLAEGEGYRETLQKIESLRQKAEARLEELTVRISRTESQLAMIATQRELLRARVLTDEGQRLVAQVDELLEGNVQVVQGNPVRSVEELLAASQPAQAYRPSVDKARQFLATKPVVPETPAVTFEASAEAPPSGPQPSKVSQDQKPIFQQD